MSLTISQEQLQMKHFLAAMNQAAINGTSDLTSQEIIYLSERFALYDGLNVDTLLNLNYVPLISAFILAAAATNPSAGTYDFPASAGSISSQTDGYPYFALSFTLAYNVLATTAYNAVISQVNPLVANPYTIAIAGTGAALNYIITCNGNTIVASTALSAVAHTFLITYVFNTTTQLAAIQGYLDGVAVGAATNYPAAAVPSAAQLATITNTGANPLVLTGVRLLQTQKQ